MTGFGLEAPKRSLSFLSRTFPQAPLSVFSAREGAWKKRKKEWVSLGIESEVSRGETLVKGDEDMLAKIKAMSIEEIAAKLESGEWSWNEAAGAYGGIPDNPEAAIPSYYTKVNSGKTKWRIMAEFFAQGGAEAGGVSIFDPTLCEACYRFWSEEGDQVVDPFAGGSVRGIVAGLLGRKYWGAELRPKQVKSNKEQAEKIGVSPVPEWREGDSLVRLGEAPPADFIFSCPPYGSLEIYSDDPLDLSTMTWEAFGRAYTEIIRLSAERLKAGGFACFVVGNYREGGIIRDLVKLTVDAFEAADCPYWDESVLVTSVGSAAIRSGCVFGRGARKLVKTHQNVLIFRKDQK